MSAPYLPPSVPPEGFEKAGSHLDLYFHSPSGYYLEFRNSAKDSWGYLGDEMAKNGREKDEVIASGHFLSFDIFPGNVVTFDSMSNHHPTLEDIHVLNLFGLFPERGDGLGPYYSAHEVAAYISGFEKTP